MEAYRVLLERYGKLFPEDVQRKCIGKSKQDLHTYLIQEYGFDKTIDELANEGAAIQKEILQSETIEIMPGEQNLTQNDLSEAGLKHVTICNDSKL